MHVMEEILHDPAHVVTAGTSLGTARGAAILLHGRGASARDMIALATHIAPPGIAVLAPQATGNSWYPYPFTAPIADNEPKLSSALDVIATILAALGNAGLRPDRVAIGGFSQGACLASEFVARNAQRYGGVIGFSGGLIGPPGTPRDYEGNLAGTPVFLGCSDVDPHIPLDRVEETAEVLAALGGRVDKRIYRGMGHSVNNEEVAAARNILALLAVGRTAA
jgi:predicted esterase